MTHYVSPIYLNDIFNQMNFINGSNKFKIVFPEYEGQINYNKGLCPVVENLFNEEMIFTNICKMPHTENEVNEFLKAVEKIYQNIKKLQKYEELNSV